MCPRCEKYKHKGKFTSADTTIGITSWCKECHADYTKGRYQEKNRDQIARRLKDQMVKAQQAVEEYEQFLMVFDIESAAELDPDQLQDWLVVAKERGLLPDLTEPYNPKPPSDYPDAVLEADRNSPNAS
jgi:hypothetical protein